jgi:heptosyltransferase-2
MQKTIETILIRCPNWVGDIVMATPALDCFRQNFPQARIIGVLGRNAQGIVRDGPWFDDLLDCEDKTLAGLRRMTDKIKALKADMAVLLPNSIRSAIPFWLARVKNIYGYRRNLRGLFLSDGPKPLRSGGCITPLPMQDYYLEICRWLGLKMPAVSKPTLFISPQLQNRADELLAKYGIRPGDRVVGLNPGASFGSSKCWPPGTSRKLLNYLSRKRNHVFYFSQAPAKKKSLAPYFQKPPRKSLIPPRTILTSNY